MGRWVTRETAEVLGPLADQRVPSAQTGEYLTQIMRLRQLAVHLDDADLPPSVNVTELQDALTAQLRRDRATAWVWDSWGIAATIQKDASDPTVPSGVLRWLDQVEAVSSEPTTSNRQHEMTTHHAGSLHTYGYLCSTVETDYGWKRTRWIGGGIAAAAGIDPSLLLPVPSSGTLLSNATAVAAQLLGWTTPNSDAVRATARPIGRITVAVTHEARTDGNIALVEPIEIRTSLLRRDDPPSNMRPNLLVYSIVRDGVEQLMTMFDVDNLTRDRLLGAAVGPVNVELEYNARITSVGTSFRGHRSITPPLNVQTAR